MPSSGIRKAPSGRYKVWWRLDDYSQGSQTFDTKAEAKEFRDNLLAEVRRGTWVDPRRGKISFDELVDDWWEIWSTERGRSPSTLEAADSRLRLHLRPYFGDRQVRVISVTTVRQWQNQLLSKRGSRQPLAHGTVMACRSLLHRILQAAVDDRRIEVNPVAKVLPPKPDVDPEVLLGNAPSRVYTPEEFGTLLAAASGGDRDHLLILVGTGLRAGEFCGLRVGRVNVPDRRLEVVAARYDAGRFGSGHRRHTKSLAGIRAVPLAEVVAEAISRQLASGRGSDLAFHCLDGRELTRYRLRYAYLRAVHRAGLAEQLDARGPHDLRHTFGTWLEDDGIPARVIDEVMGHAASRRAAGTSPMASVYRHTTDAMRERVREVIDARLRRALKLVLRSSNSIGKDSS